MMMAQRTVGNFFRLPMFDQLNFAHPRRRTQVIHDRISFVESLRGKDVLVSDAFVFVSRRRAVAVKPDVMLSRNLSKLLIIRHNYSFKLTSTPHPALSLLREERKTTVVNLHANIAMARAVRLS